MKSVMLTGATGFIGAHIAEKLIQKNISTRLFVRKRNSLMDLLEKKGAKIYVAQPDDPGMLAKSLPGVDTVIHCAGATKALKEDDYFKANLEFTIHILNLLNKQQNIIFISSQAAAGPSYSPVPIDEKAVPKPLTYYGKSKLLAECHIREWGMENAKRYTIIRPSVVYGPGEKELYKYFKLIKIGLLVLFGNGKKRISIIHIEDLVCAVIAAAERPSTGETYFVANDESYSWEEIGCAIKKALNKTFLLKVKLPEFAAYPLAYFFVLLSLLTGKPALMNSQKIIEMKQSAWLCSNRKIKKTLNWRPKFSLEKGIQQTADWYMKKNWI